jgi:glycine betaine/proline transport system substrate-binding protein
MKKILALFISLALVITLVGCTTSSTDSSSGVEGTVVTIGEGDWDSNAFLDQVVKIILEEGYGAEADIITADTSIMVSSMTTDDIDVCLELWSDNVVTYDDDIAAGNYVELGLNYDDNMQGLYIPTYLAEEYDIVTVEDLKDYADLFPDPEDSSMGIIYGGPEGWSATEMLHKKMEAYGLDEYYNFKTIDSNATLSATLASAYEKEEPWVGYNWEPTWVMGMYDMTLLEDSEYSEEDFAEGIGAFPAVDVTVCASTGFAENEDNAALVEFFENFHASSEVISEALAYMQDNDASAEEAAEWFLTEREDVWKDMVPDDVYESVTEYLQQ